MTPVSWMSLPRRSTCWTMPMVSTMLPFTWFILLETPVRLAECPEQDGHHHNRVQDNVLSTDELDTGGYSSPWTVRCTFCGQMGHGRAECQIRMQEPGADIEQCTYCGQIGHCHMECPFDWSDEEAGQDPEPLAGNCRRYAIPPRPFCAQSFGAR